MKKHKIGLRYCDRVDGSKRHTEELKGKIKDLLNEEEPGTEFGYVIRPIRVINGLGIWQVEVYYK